MILGQSCLAFRNPKNKRDKTFLTFDGQLNLSLPWLGPEQSGQICRARCADFALLVRTTNCGISAPKQLNIRCMLPKPTNKEKRALHFANVRYIAIHDIPPAMAYHGLRSSPCPSSKMLATRAMHVLKLAADVALAPQRNVGP